MSYTPTTWANGDTITAEKMNKIEGGIANASAGAGGLVVHWDATNSRTVETTGEIAEAIAAGKTVVLDQTEYNNNFTFTTMSYADKSGTSGGGEVYLNVTFGSNAFTGLYPDGYLAYAD